MVNQDYVNRLIALIMQGVITVDNVKIQEYKDAVQAVLATQ